MEDALGAPAFTSRTERERLHALLQTGPEYTAEWYRAFEWLSLFMEQRRAVRDGGVDTDNRRIPSGYTYLGQLMAHDLSLNKRPLDTGPAASGAEQINPRTPIFDLDTLYGGGPLVSPHLYARADGAGGMGQRTKFRLGTTSESLGAPSSQRDLPRYRAENEEILTPSGDTLTDTPIETLICDPRNEDNLILSQLTVLIYRVHNKFVDELEAHAPPDVLPQDIFQAARWLTLHAYRSIIRHDYLPRVLHHTTHAEYENKTLDPFHLFSASEVPGDLPAEFTMSVMRAAHAMVRHSYRFPTISDDPRLQTATLQKLLAFKPMESAVPGTTRLMRRGEPMPLQEVWVAQSWDMFFPDNSVTDFEPSKRLMAASPPFLARANHVFPPLDDPQEAAVTYGALVFRDFVRGLINLVPSGRTLAVELGTPVLSADEIKTKLLDVFAPDPGSKFTKEEVTQIIDKVAEDPPLYLYVLAEAELMPDTQGACFGPLGGKILAEVMYPALLLGEQADGPRPALVAGLPEAKRTELMSFQAMPQLTAWV